MAFKRLNFSSDKSRDQDFIVAALRELDSKLSSPASIILCGSASVLLQGVDFRKTFDIDFCERPSEDIVTLIEQVWNGRPVFDFNAAGIIGLLIDYMDRIVPVNLSLKYLTISCLSRRDWIVSKLASPKLDDVLLHPDVTLDDLLWVQSEFHNYGGISFDRALLDLKWLIREIGER